MRFLVSQIGAREHYAIARALAGRGAFSHLYTDAWVRPGSPLGLLRRNLRERYHPDLRDAGVTAWNLRCLMFECLAKAAGWQGWRRIIARNHWFQNRVVSALSRTQPSTIHHQPSLFSYSYAALKPFEFARQRGWKTVLGQIDPGPVEERIVAGLHRDNPAYAGAWDPAPATYWQEWRAECDLATVIVVNSEWSREALVQEGISGAKIRVVPLAYEPPPECDGFKRSYPAEFTAARPLRLLFLGQINLRKGAESILKALPLMAGQPVEFWFVGSLGMTIPKEFQQHPLVRWFGPVPRGETARFYRDADLFLFPTHSDGFGLTQLEALAWRLPIIVSRHCGQVVNNERNGLVLETVTPSAIASAIQRCLKSPSLLEDLSSRCMISQEFSLPAIADKLIETVH